MAAVERILQQPAEGKHQEIAFHFFLQVSKGEEGERGVRIENGLSSPRAMAGEILKFLLDQIVAGDAERLAGEPAGP